MIGLAGIVEPILWPPAPIAVPSKAIWCQNRVTLAQKNEISIPLNFPLKNRDLDLDNRHITTHISAELHNYNLRFLFKWASTLQQQLQLPPQRTYCNKQSKNSDKRHHLMLCPYWGLNDPFACRCWQCNNSFSCRQRSRDFQWFSMGWTTPKIAPFLWEDLDPI